MSTHQLREYWDDQAAEYDSYPDHGLLDSDVRAAWKDLLRTWLPTRPSAVVDLACGTGTMSVLMAELGHRVRAVDLSGEMVARARAKAAPYGSAVEIAQADAGDPPFSSGTVDVVFARHVLWTLPDPERVLQRWAELLRPGGRMVLIEGRWGLEPAVVDGLPWRQGVPSQELAARVQALGFEPTVVQLRDEVFWGRQLEHERYLLAARRLEES
ncbi:MAG TPA: class I SAM-dependent methyltransferase [Pedococcus sp.]|jgi:SAM-dependent methyltransferase|nr:class I SAM-dependent methyltransferase [Pedococcus sp.]